MEGIQIFVTLKLRFSERAKKFQINHLLSFDVTEYRISANSFCGNLFFFKFGNYRKFK